MCALEEFDNFVGTASGIAIQQRIVLVVIELPALFDVAQPVSHRVCQRVAALGIVEHVFLQVGVALHHPDIAKHLIEHARATPGFPFTTQFKQNVPCIGTQQPHDDFAIGKRGVVVWNLS